MARAREAAQRAVAARNAQQPEARDPAVGAEAAAVERDAIDRALPAGAVRAAAVRHAVPAILLRRGDTWRHVATRLPLAEDSRPHQPSSDDKRASPAPVIGFVIRPTKILRFHEIRKDLLIAPILAPALCPPIIICGITAYIEHAVD